MLLHCAGEYKDPASLLAVSKRGLEEFADKVGSWEDLFTKSSAELREAGMNIKQSKYCLWLLEKYRCAAWSSSRTCSPGS